jgi:alkanesulfonate monooxygenase SsuD/methylene tetrahydromethanopterin reductase-like flavin-dependent oxidoreductase (luciferase family)
MDIPFGIIDHIDHQEIPISQTFDERLEQVVKFDAHGFYAYHVTEHHFTDHGLASSPIAFLSAVARLTKKIKLIPTVLVLPTYQPLRLAEEICMLDQLSHGRVEFGVGRGVVPHELSLFGINPHEAADIAKESLEVLRLALTKEEVLHRGEYYKFFNVPMILKMFQKELPPLWVTSSKLDAAGAAGAAGDNFMTIINPARCKSTAQCGDVSTMRAATATTPLIARTKR